MQLLWWLQHRHDQTGDASQHIKTHVRGRTELMSSLLQDLDYWCRVWIAQIPERSLIPTIYYCKFTGKRWYYLWQKGAANNCLQWVFAKKKGSKEEKKDVFSWEYILVHNHDKILNEAEVSFHLHYEINRVNLLVLKKSRNDHLR